MVHACIAARYGVRYTGLGIPARRNVNGGCVCVCLCVCVCVCVCVCTQGEAQLQKQMHMQNSALSAIFQLSRPDAHTHTHTNTHTQTHTHTHTYPGYGCTRFQSQQLQRLQNTAMASRLVCVHVCVSLTSFSSTTLNSASRRALCSLSLPRFCDTHTHTHTTAHAGLCATSRQWGYMSDCVSVCACVCVYVCVCVSSQGIHPSSVAFLDVHVRRSHVLQDALTQILNRPEVSAYRHTHARTQARTQAGSTFRCLCPKGQGHKILCVRVRVCVSTCVPLCMCVLQELKKPLRVTFIGPGGVAEEGLDEGGVSREFFQLLVGTDTHTHTHTCRHA